MKMYKLYAAKRPKDTCVSGAPFYLEPKTTLNITSECPGFMNQRVGRLLRVMAEKAGLTGKNAPIIQFANAWSRSFVIRI